MFENWSKLMNFLLGIAWRIQFKNKLFQIARKPLVGVLFLLPLELG